MDLAANTTPRAARVFAKEVMLYSNINVLVLGSKIPRLPGDHFQYVEVAMADGIG